MNIALSFIVLSACIALGKILGQTKICGISLGATWILFVGIVFAHFGYGLDTTVLHYFKEFGLILFVYSIGMQVGPSFFSSFRTGGLKLNLLAVLTVLGGVLVAWALIKLTGTDAPTMVGIMSGAVTNTPGLGAAQQAYADATGGDPGSIALGYAVAYPLGVIGCILSFVLIKSIFYRKPRFVVPSVQTHAQKAPAYVPELSKGKIVSRKIFVSKRKLNGMSLGKLEFEKYLGAQVLRIRRAGISISVGKDTILQMGDVVTVAGPELSVDAMEKVLGNSLKKLDTPNLIPIFAGIALGCLLGSVPIHIPGVPQPIKLGLAGGPLIVSILIGAFGPRLKVVTYTTTSANLMIREIGICLFLACVGLEAGGEFVDTIVNGGGLVWICYGALITLLPLLLVGLIGKLMKVDYYTLIGVLSGACTNPPALSFASEQEKNGDKAAVGCATVYPLAMFLRVLAAQMMVLFML